MPSEPLLKTLEALIAEIEVRGLPNNLRLDDYASRQRPP
jgi:hypothetical protein